MCGIVGYIGNRKAAPILIKGLKNLEYRGYDSAGICTINNKEVLLKKDIGKIEEIDKKVNLADLEGNIGISHCRWATHGSVTKENAHPHTDCSGKIGIVHNGIIENYNELKNELKKKGHKFSSETDTEIIAHLIEEYYKGDFKEAVLKALKKLDGSYALGIIHSEHDELIAARNEHSSTVFVSQTPVSKWHSLMPNSTIADAILDRIVHSAMRVELKGESHRKTKNAQNEKAVEA